MKRISYGGSTILTGDAIADALLDYATALARAGSADHVRVPGIGPLGRVELFDVVIGPASQVYAENSTGEEEVLDEVFVADLRHRVSLVAAGRAGDGADPVGG